MCLLLPSSPGRPGPMLFNMCCLLCEVIGHASLTSIYLPWTKLISHWWSTVENTSGSYYVIHSQVTVAMIDLSPKFSYTSVPRYSPHYFLLAKARNTSHYAILAGPSNIFLDNNFIAKVHNIMYKLDIHKLYIVSMLNSESSTSLQ